MPLNWFREYEDFTTQMQDTVQRGLMELDTTALSSWLWDAACAIRGPVDAPKFKDYILPLVFLKQLSDVFEDEMARLATEYEDRATAERIVEEERQRGIVAQGRGSVRFYIPKIARWEAIRKQTTGIGQYLTDAVRAVLGSHDIHAL